jgi:hypothetical protein
MIKSVAGFAAQPSIDFMSDFKMFTIDAPLLPPIHGMVICAASMSHARKKALKMKWREINLLIAADVLRCPYGDIPANRQRKINRKAMAVLQNGGSHLFTLTDAWAIAMPDVKWIEMRRRIRHEMMCARIAFLRRHQQHSKYEREPIFHDGRAAVEHGNDYYARHPEMMLKPQFR